MNSHKNAGLPGTPVPSGPEIGTTDYWMRHVRQPVRFQAGIRTMYEAGCRVFVEVGPSSTLLALGRQTVSDDAAAWLPSISPEAD